MDVITASIISMLRQCCCCCCCWCAAPIQEEGEECVRSCLRLEQNWTFLKEERELLQAKENDLKTKIASEARELRYPAKEVELWLKRSASLAGRESQLKKDYEELEKCPCNCTPNVCRRFELGRRVSEELRMAKKQIAERAPLDSLFSKQSPCTVEKRQCQLAHFAMARQLTSLRTYFNDGGKSIIGIHGLSGVGKTTLLKQFHDELIAKEGFDYHVVIFIEVSNSKVSDVAGMQMKIAYQLGLSLKDEEKEAVRANNIHGLLSKRKFVIFLDDVHQAFKLREVGIPDPSEAAVPRRKLIIASQLKNVCDQMEVHNNNTIEIECLNSEEAWRLFKSDLGEEAKTAIESDGVIKKDAEAIVARCAGLPLAIKIIGKAVAQLKDPSEWLEAEYKMNMASSHLQGMEALFLRLKYSYDQLEPRVQQRCFLYCALFPECGSIKKSQLTDYWIGEGLIDETWDGNRVIDVLVSARLLEEEIDNSRVRMHNIIRQLALWLTKPDPQNVSNSTFLVQAGCGLKEAPTARKWESATRISLMSNNIEKLPRSPECSGLSTLLLQNNPNLRQLHPGFFRGMPSLKVLDISHTAIEELPIAAGTLTGLQHLNLCDTRISKLPQALATLKKLRHLDLSETSALKVIPDGTISVLSELRVLNIYRSRYKIQGKEDLNLERLENLEFLGITVHSEDVLEKLQADDLLARWTYVLSLQDCPGMKSIKVSVFEHMQHLKVLYVHGCSELKHLDLDVGDTWKEWKLEELALVSLLEFEGISEGLQPHCYLRNLCDLTIDSCPQLKNVTWVLRLQSLQKLAISKCDVMEKVVEEDESPQEEGEIRAAMEGENGTNTAAGMRSIEAFGKLKSIILKDLTNLKRICPSRSFPNLKFISVDNCPNLERLPLVVSECPTSKLKEIRGSKDWWSRLVWDGELPSYFGGLFVPI